MTMDIRRSLYASLLNDRVDSSALSSYATTSYIGSEVANIKPANVDLTDSIIKKSETLIKPS